jgi:hypothetical protein
MLDREGPGAFRVRAVGKPNAELARLVQLEPE